MKRTLLLVTMVALVAITAFADLVPWPGPDPGLVYIGGQGFGNIKVLAGAQANSQDLGGGNYELVCGGPGGTNQQNSWGTCGLLGANNTDLIHLDRPITLASIGIADFSTAASQVVLIFNGDQAGGANLITLQQLALGFWYSSNGITFAAPPNWGVASYEGDNLGGQSGQGSAGYAYALDTTQAAAAQAVLNAIAGANLNNIYLGGGFSAGCNIPGRTNPAGCLATDDGPDDLKVTSKLGVVVPEPASILGLGTVLLLVGSRLRRKKA